ncbi:laccase [Gymnopus androsaceus JB14]|uniref:laccase n=1 Tax=Gymnopus androsaceus JB14 TaxID=1447944 RepID=A0A6A4HLX1_9AGAR|nr:laccase [Gymnopus androsaceus JB14]
MAPFPLIGLGLLASLPLLVTAAIGPVADLNIVNSKISPDGYTRSAVLAGGVFPGPLITGNKGDTFQINVINDLTDDTMLKSTSIHWHGLFQKGSNWADGPAFVNQCPIAPGNSFLYEFTVPDQAGTFWYHSHLSTQYCDGLRGPFVVYDSDDPYIAMYDVDDDSTVITLADWYHPTAPELALVPPPPIYNATLINGLGRELGGPSTDLTVITVKKGLRYRFRVIAISCQLNFNFSIDGHDLTIIETDGEYTEPLTVDSIQVFAGQRFSVVVSMTLPINNYAIRANPNEGNTGFEGGINMAILRYAGAAEEDPDWHEIANDNPKPFYEQDLHALIDPAAPGEAYIEGADVSLNMILGLDPTTFLFTINGHSWVPPTVPVLLQILSGTYKAAELMPAGSIYPLPLNKSIQLTFSPGTAAAAGGPHPFHLHGHSFSVVRSASSDTYNFENPVRRDVVSTGLIGDNVTIRFMTDNSGPWFLHCHIDWHLDTGFAVVLAEDAPGTKAANNVPDTWDQLCPIYNSLTDEQKGGITSS